MRYRPGEPIVRAGFSGEGFFAIAGGRARVQRSDGHEVMLAQGDFFGELSLIDGASRNATVVAETDLVALKLTRQTFLDLLDAEPTVCRALVDRWSSASARSRRARPLRPLATPARRRDTCRSAVPAWRSALVASSRNASRRGRRFYRYPHTRSVRARLRGTAMSWPYPRVR